MVRVIKSNSVPENSSYEYPLKINFGVDDSTCGKDVQLTMGYTVVPPGAKIEKRHFHANCDAAGYIISGRMKLTCGTGDDKYYKTIEAGSFFYYPQGEAHGGENLSDTEEVRLVFTYPGVPNKEAAGTTEVDD